MAERGPARHRHGDAGAAGARGDDARDDAQLCGLAVQLVLEHLHVVEPRCVPGLQRHRPPDAAGDEARAPVPAVVVGRLARPHADHLLALVVGGGQLVAELVVGRLDLRDRRREAHENVVVARLEVAFHVGAPAPEHVVGGQHRRAVHEHLGERVEAGEHQLDALARQRRARRPRWSCGTPTTRSRSTAGPSRSAGGTGRRSCPPRTDRCGRSPGTVAGSQASSAAPGGATLRNVQPVAISVRVRFWPPHADRRCFVVLAGPSSVRLRRQRHHDEKRRSRTLTRTGRSRTRTAARSGDRRR